MENGKVIFELSDKKVSGGRFVIEKFSSLSDMITVRLGLEKNENAVFSLIVSSFDKDGNETQILNKSQSDTDGCCNFEYSFDPISLSVYKNAVEFGVEINSSADEFTISALSISESLNEVSKETLDDVKNTFTDENGEAKVWVKQLNGEKIAVPRVPKKSLFIGNSLVFGMCGKYGMCSSAPDKDYYHYVTSYIKKYNPCAEFDKLYGSHFEHSESIEMFNDWYYDDCKISASYKMPAASKFKEDLDLIILQVADNVNTEKKDETFLKTADMLIERIKVASPRARIIWVHGWYKKAVADPHIEKVCKKWEIERISITSCRSKETEAHNQKYYFDVNEGVQKEVRETWVTHPGDLGMKKIADKIIRKLELV